MGRWPLRLTRARRARTLWGRRICVFRIDQARAPGAGGLRSGVVIAARGGALSRTNARGPTQYLVAARFAHPNAVGRATRDGRVERRECRRYCCSVHERRWGECHSRRDHRNNPPSVPTISRNQRARIAGGAAPRPATACTAPAPGAGVGPSLANRFAHPPVGGRGDGRATAWCRTGRRASGPRVVTLFDQFVLISEKPGLVVIAPTFAVTA